MSDQNNMQTAPKQQTNIQKFKAAMVAPSVEEQFRNALGENKEAFVASLIDLYNTDSKLQECEPNKVVMEALKAAVLKLPINKALGFAYIIPFNNSVRQPNGSYIKVPTPTFVIGYKAYIQMAMRTGQYKTINADIVYEGEVQKVNKLTGEINFDGERKSDKVVGYFAYFELLNGFSKTLYVDLEKMAKHAKKYSPTLIYKKEATIESLMKLAGQDPKGIGWEGDFDSMSLKTVLRSLLSKYGFLSIEMQNAIASDSEVEAVQSIQAPQSQPPVIDIDSEDVSDKKEDEPKTEEKPPYM